jgi:hypothetical protein
MTTIITSDNVQITLTDTFINNCPAIKDMVSDLGMSCDPLGNQSDFPIQHDSETINAFAQVFEKLATCDGSEQSVADMDKWLSNWGDFKTPAGHFDIQRYQKYIIASSHLTGGGGNQHTESEDKPKKICGAKQITKILGKKMIELVSFKTPEQIREAANICGFCYRPPCLNPEIKKIVCPVANIEKMSVENVEIDERIPCEDCDACKAVYCQHNKLLNHFPKEEEDKPIPRYEEWKIKMDLIEEFKKKKASE